jgi:hypothetical protein
VHRSIRPSLAARAWRPVLGALAFVALAASTAHGEDGPTYEDQRLTRALAEGGFTVVAAPEGRPVRRIHFVRHDVLAEDEPFPTFFNVFHALTHEDVIRRELLFREGEPWDQPRVDETMRNLRALSIFTIVRVVAVEPRDPEEPPPGSIESVGPPPSAPADTPPPRQRGTAAGGQGASERGAPAAPPHEGSRGDRSGACGAEVTVGCGGVAPRRPERANVIVGGGVALGRPERADVIDVVVFTRDLWSIRVETSFQVTDGFLDQLAITLIERNLAGAGKQAALSFELLPRTFSLGDVFQDPRLFGGSLALTQTFALVFNRSSGLPEGSRGTVAIGEPLRDLRQTWGWEAQVGYEDVIGRQLSGRELLTYDVPETNAVEAIPRVWDQNILTASVQLRYQAGTLLKHRLDGGFAGSDRALSPRDGLTADEAEAFRRDVLPPERRQLYPFIRWTGFTPEYATFVDLASFGLTEDVRLGPWWVAQIAFPLEAFGSSDDALFWSLSAGFIAAPGGGLVDLQGQLAGRLEQSRVIDQQYTLRLRGATPRLAIGRLIANASYEGRRRDSGRTLVTLGGDNGLRGFASQALYGFGASRMRFNAEWRTPPWIIASAHLGGVLFWDGGAVWEGDADIDFRQSVGLGLRLLFPQFNRFTFRFDLGVPLDGDGFTVLATFGSLQAVPLTSTEDATLSQ